MADHASRMAGVILAAGKGTRMYPFAESLPKPILPVGNRPLLEYQLEMMKACGVDEVFIVIGHRGYAIVRALGNGGRQGLTIRYVEQIDTLGLAHALGKLEPYIDSPFVLFLGDIYFLVDDLRPALREVASGRLNSVLISKIEKDPAMIKRNFTIIDDERGRVRRVIEKPRYTQTEIKGCGLYVFDQHIFDAIRRTPRTALRDEYEITDSIQILINDGYAVEHRPIVQQDLNLTIPEDLLSINLIDLARRGLTRLIGRDVSFPSGTVIENSVIGDGAVIEQPVRIENSVVFPHVRVTSRSDLDSVLIEGETTIHCKGKPLAWTQFSTTLS